MDTHSLNGTYASIASLENGDHEVLVPRDEVGFNGSYDVNMKFIPVGFGHQKRMSRGWTRRSLPCLRA